VFLHQKLTEGGQGKHYNNTKAEDDLFAETDPPVMVILTPPNDDVVDDDDNNSTQPAQEQRHNTSHPEPSRQHQQPRNNSVPSAPALPKLPYPFPHNNNDKRALDYEI
jgi:hypothetical protein